MIDWIDIKKRKPKIGEQALIYTQGYGENGNYWSGYEVAIYGVNPYDKRKRAFIHHLQYDRHDPWIYRGVTHWAELNPAQKKEETHT